MTSQQRVSTRQKIAGRDAVWLQDSPTNLMVVNTVFTLDRIDLETLRQLFSERILKEERFERFRLNVVREGAKAYWE